jgi:hypothetical protein
LHQMYPSTRRSPRQPILITKIKTLQRPAHNHTSVFFFWL